MSNSLKTYEAAGPDDAKQEQKAETYRKERDGGLLTIGIFKLAKSALFFAIGVGAIHFLHKDLMEAALRLARVLQFDPERHFTSIVLGKLDMIDTHRLKLIGTATFAYSALAMTEGIGLLLEKTWAEYLTISLTVAFLPWEFWELTRRVSWLRVAVLLVNFLVLWYLLWLRRRKRTLSREGIAV